MSPVRKSLLQRLKAMLAGVCARFRRPRAPVVIPPAPEPVAEPTDAELAAIAAAHIEQALTQLMEMFAAWKAGTLPPELLRPRRSRPRRARQPRRNRAPARPAARPPTSRAARLPRAAIRPHPRKHHARCRQKPHFRVKPTHAQNVPGA